MRRYLITGATGGLGKSVLAALQERCAEANILGRADTVLTAGRHGKPPFLPLDLAASPMSWITEEIKHAGAGPGGIPPESPQPGFHGIVHCAGVELVQALRMTSDEQYRTAMMAADSAFAILRAAASRGVMADGGSIVLMSSVAAHRGTAGMAAYSAGKAAIEAMARCAAIELAPRRIRVNCVAAGAFESPMHTRVIGRMPSAAVDGYSAKHPLGFGPVDAVRDAVLHLLSDASCWTTGTTVVVDGGFLAA